jgi:hypothetical protein
MPKPINGEFYTQADDELMMITPDEWPRWPWLPLKKPDWVVGAMFGGPEPDGSIEIWLVNIFDPLLDSLAGKECERFATPKEACDAGWKVS